ncbi:MAG TPA: conjugal transfer protein TraF [Cellvibrio sp.]|nr:conjugal transfer protein TraF [Cellvibrio sp.]
MKKTLLSLALISTCSSAIAGELYNGRLAGMSGAGYATSDYSDGLLLNPALGAAHTKDDDFALVLSLGALGSDKDKLIDAMDDLVDYTDELKKISNVQDLDPNSANKLKAYMAKVDDKHVQVLAGASLVVAVPNDTLSVALVAKGYGLVGIHSEVDDSDYVLIDNAVNAPFDPEDLKSSVTGRGAFVEEIGISFAKAIVDMEDEKILVGVTPKRVSVETIVYKATVSSYDEDDLDSDDFTKESSGTSLDAGITSIMGDMRYSFVISDLISKDFKTITTEKFELKSKATVAVGYKKGWLTAEGSLDLNATPAFGLGGDTQMFRAGIDMSPVRFVHIRAGLAHDLEDTLEDTYSIGLGFFDVLDISAFTGSNETTGASIGLGMRF